MTALVFAVALLFLYAAWRAIIAFLFAIFFAYLLEAPVSRFQVWLRGSRGAAIAVVYVLLGAGVAVIFLVAGQTVVDEAQKLMQQGPGMIDKLSSGSLLQQLAARHGWSQATVDRVTQFLGEHRGEIFGNVQNFVLRAVRTIQGMWWLLLVPILAVFFLKDGHKLGQGVINSVEDRKDRRIVAETVDQMNTMLGHYIRSQLTLAALAMVVITFVLWIMRVPYAFVLGPVAGALEFIPVAGPAIGGAMVVIVAMLSGYHHVLWVFLFLLLWRGIQDYVTAPRIMGGSLELHPLAVLFGVMAGGEVAGVIGVFLSVPVIATLRILWDTWLRYRKSPRIAPAA